MTAATLADFDAAGLVVAAGSVALIGAQVAGRVNLAGARIDTGHGTTALNADGAIVGRRFILDQAYVRGTVSICTGRLGSRMLLQGARIDNPGGTALRLSPADIVAGMFCEEMTLTGRADLTGARIAGHLDLNRTCLSNPDGVALDARALDAAQVSLPAGPVQGAVNLSHARIGVLRDDPQHWPPASTSAA